MRKLLILLTILSTMLLNSCKKESDDPSFCKSDWDTKTATEYNALIAAYNAYANDMSVANCNAYKAAFASFIDALEPFLECSSWSAADREEVQDLIDESKASMNQLNCQ